MGNKQDIDAQQLTVLFDLDGVVIDTEPQYSAFWTEIGRQFFPGLPSFADDIKGHSLVSIFEDYFSDSAAQRAEIERLLLEHEARMEYPYTPGAELLLGNLREAGVQTAVVTSSDLNKMARVYEAHPELPRLFSRIFTAEDSARSKPAPDCYVNAARALGADIGRCIVIEDSVNGLLAARASGAIVAGVLTTMPLSQVEPLADAVFSDLSALSCERLCALARQFATN